MTTSITLYDDQVHRGQVTALREAVFGYESAHNLPALVIDKKTATNDGLFFVAVSGNLVIGTLICGEPTDWTSLEDAFLESLKVKGQTI